MKNKLQIVQNKVVRFILGLHHRKNWVVFEADYEFKLLVMNGKKGENMDILKLKQMFSFVIVFKTF
jgi:hypothetical protein